MTEASGRSRRPLSAARLILGLVIVASLLFCARSGRLWSRAHLQQMLRTPEAGPAACWSCHAGGKPRPRPVHDAVQPTAVLLLPGGDLLVTASLDGSLYRLDPRRGRVRARVDVGPGPHGLALLDDRPQVLVSLRDADQVAVVDLRAGRVVERIPVGREPTGLAVVSAQGVALVANTGSDDVSVIDLATRQERYRLPAGRQPYRVAPQPGGEVAVVTNRLSNRHAVRSAPHSELTVLRLTPEVRVLARHRLPSIHMVEGLAFTPDGRLALAAGVATRNLVPATQVARGWVTADVLVVLELAGAGRLIPIVIDEANDYHADPSALAVDPRGKVAYLASGGRDRVWGLDLAHLDRWLASMSPAELAALGNTVGPGSALLRTELATRSNPVGVAVGPQGRRLYVTERLSDSVAVFDLPDGRLAQRIELGPPGPPSQRVLGARLFHRATAFQGQFSCRSCHPDGHLGGLTYDFDIDGVGENFLDNRSLRGLSGTQPFKWIGLNPTIAAQCGPRFVKVLGRAESFDSDELAALSTYLLDIPTRSGLAVSPTSPAAQRGREIYYRPATNAGAVIPIDRRCPSCHPAPTYTSGTRSRVGTATSTDFTDVFDAAHLLDIGDGAPYLHDGRAATLHELLTDPGLMAEHGEVGDLSRGQVNDLVEFLRTL